MGHPADIISAEFSAENLQKIYGNSTEILYIFCGNYETKFSTEKYTKKSTENSTENI